MREGKKEESSKSGRNEQEKCKGGGRKGERKEGEKA